MDAALRQTWWWCPLPPDPAPVQQEAHSPGERRARLLVLSLPHFRHGSTSARRGYIACPESHPCEYRAEAWNPGSRPEPGMEPRECRLTILAGPAPRPPRAGPSSGWPLRGPEDRDPLHQCCQGLWSLWPPRWLLGAISCLLPPAWGFPIAK